MKIADLRKAEYLVMQRNSVARIIDDLNKINGGEKLSIPLDALSYVDQNLAAKGLLSLLLERAAEIDNALKELGVDV